MNQYKYSAEHQALLPLPEVERPSENNTDFGKKFFGEAHNEWLSRRLIVPDEYKGYWKDGQQVTEGVDFKLDYPPLCLPEVAIPLLKPSSTVKKEDEENPEYVISKKYDEFFGKGYWERDYKKHIVLFAKQCYELLSSKPKN